MVFLKRSGYLEVRFKEDDSDDSDGAKLTTDRVGEASNGEIYFYTAACAW